MKWPTKKELTFLFHQSNLIEGYDDARFDEQQMVAWEYLRDVPFDQLDHHCIQKVQKILTLRQTDLQPDWRGYYRKMDVWVGRRACPDPGLVKGMMDNWLLDYQKLDPVDAHVVFEHIHPFVDGNGRTGRLLMWWSQMHLGDPLSQITFDGRQEYYQWFTGPVWR